MLNTSDKNKSIGLGFDQTQALREGWCIIDENSEGRLRIQKLDEGPSRFTDDYLAEDYVRWRATLDDDVNHYHLSAIDYVETNNSSIRYYNIMFDCAATIVTRKNFENLSVEELVDAMRARLIRIEQENGIEAFSFIYEYEDLEPALEESARLSAATGRPDDETEAEVSSAGISDLELLRSVEFIEASDLTRDYAWGPDFWEIFCASSPFSLGDNNRTLVTASRFLDRVDNCLLDCIPSEELNRLVEKLEALGETYIELEN